MDDIPIRVALPSGAKLLVAVRPAGVVRTEAESRSDSNEIPADSEEPVGSFEASMIPVLKTIEELASELYGVLSRAQPVKASVEFGIELAWAPGALLSALLVNGSSKAAIKVTLEWAKPAELPRGAGS